MEIIINITEEELPASERSLIKECLGIDDETTFTHALSKLAKSSFMEYTKMFIEKGLPTKADEIKQERLFSLLIHYFGNRLPTENELSSIFQLTQSQSKSLLRNTKSRYRTKIANFIKTTLLTTFHSFVFNKEADYYEFICTSPTIIEELNLIISQKEGALEAISKVKGSACKYQCSVDTYNLLKKELV